MTRLLILFLFALYAISATGQNENLIRNPSFDGVPAPGSTPAKWFDCGFEGETPVDIQPDQTFGVNTLPFDGYSYLGMVVRDNSTWEAVSQRLKMPLIPGKTYYVSMALAQAKRYESPSRLRGDGVILNYDTPVRCFLWGGIGGCAREELLVATSPIGHQDWQVYQFLIQPNDTLEGITIAAMHDPLYPKISNGNLLLDAVQLYEVADGTTLDGASKNLNTEMLAFDAFYSNLERAGRAYRQTAPVMRQPTAGRTGYGGTRSATKRKQESDIDLAKIEGRDAARRYELLLKVKKTGNTSGLYNLALVLDNPGPYLAALKDIGAIQTQHELAAAIKLRDQVRAKGQQPGDRKKIKAFYRQKGWTREFNRCLKAYEASLK